MKSGPALAFVMLLLASSTALAGWAGKGSYEPSVTADRVDGWMYTSSDVTPTNANPLVRKVYFNGFVAQYTPVGVMTIFPNLASQRTGFGPNTYYFAAMLGVWKDCNKDGYVGYGDQGLYEYRVDLLPDESVCKRTTTPIGGNGRVTFDWFPSHNDGQWVREMLPIQWNTGNAQQLGDLNEFNINANDTRVWADIGLPTSPGAASRTCAYIPYGMTRSTGGLVHAQDCRTGWLVTDTLNAQSTEIRVCVQTTCQTHPTGLDELGLGRITFSDHPREQYRSASRLNQQNPWGDETRASYVDAWDCSSPQLHSVKASNTTYVNVSRPRAPPGVNAGGSPAGTVNGTLSGFDECKRTTSNDGVFHAGHASEAPYEIETGFIDQQEADNEDAKTKNDFMLPAETRRPAVPYGSPLGRGTNADLGARTGLDGFWYAPGRTGAPVYNGTLNMTFYAHVTSATASKYGLSLPKDAALGVYGSAVCPIIAAGAPNAKGWACDPSKWWRGAEGQDVEPRGDGRNGSINLGPGPDGQAPTVGARVGTVFNLRDIDCYDESIQPLRAAGIHSGTASTMAFGTHDRCAWEP